MSPARDFKPRRLRSESIFRALRGAQQSLREDMIERRRTRILGQETIRRLLSEATRAALARRPARTGFARRAGMPFAATQSF